MAKIVTGGVKIVSCSNDEIRRQNLIVCSDLLNSTENKYDYLPTTVNICSEVVKLVLCVVLALWVKKKGKYLHLK